MSSAPAWNITFDRNARIQVGLLAIAFIAVFYEALAKLVQTWSQSSDWSHGPIIPLFSVYLVYSHWDKIKASPVRATWIGLLIMFVGLGGYQYFMWVQPRNYAQHTMMLFCLLGMIVFLCGLPVLRIAWVPWLYLFFAVPLPKGIYFRLTDPLRQLAASVTTSVLSLFPNLDIEKVGSTIRYYYDGAVGSLGVEDACSGMRSAMTLCALGVAIAFISDRPWWQRAILIGSCIPIAVFSNFIRVTVTCILHIFVDPAYAGGSYHMALGLVTLLIAFGIFSGLGWVLSHLFVDEAEPSQTVQGS